MEVDGATEDDILEEDLPTCQYLPLNFVFRLAKRHVDSSIEAPPSVLPQRKYCDITGLEARQPHVWNSTQC